jgi:periplasmic protein TonB
MSSLPQETRASLDDSLVLPFDTWGKLKAARSIDIKEVIVQLRVAAEAAEKLRAFVLAERPGASWKNRQELDALLDKIEKDIQVRTLRSQLLDLAAELERGTVTHRRAARVQQVSQFRNAAIKELRTKAGTKGAPPTLPGPVADHWVDWACALEEPGDARSLEILRNSFPSLDSFVSHLEAGMWQVEAVPETTAPKTEKARFDNVQKDLRERLRSLAAELLHGSVVHHRAVRVNQLNQLRDEAVKELKSQADAKGMPAPLPGPAVDQWVEWAYSLREPEDTEAVESIRNGFPHLDDFVAHLEPNMWVPADPAVVAAAAAAAVASVAAPKASAAAAASGQSVSSKSAAAVAEAPAPLQMPPLLVDEDDEENSFGDWLREKKSSVGRMPGRKKAESAEKAAAPKKASGTEAKASAGLADNLKSKRTAMVAGAAVAVLMVAILGTMGWRSHRNRAASNVVSAAVPSVVDQTANAGTVLPISGQGIEVTQGVVAPKDSSMVPSAQAANTNSQTDASKAKQKENAPATPEPAKKTAQLDDGELRTPTAIPKAGNGAASSGSDNAPELALNSPNRMLSNVVSAPVSKPQFSGQKGTPSSGVTQGLLLQSVKPVYPLQAQQAHVEGTVVLSAVIGKDGSVESVKVVSGHPMLTQAAVDAVKRWRYKPYYLNGEAVQAETEIKVKFAPPQ